MDVQYFFYSTNKSTWPNSNKAFKVNKITVDIYILVTIAK